MNKEHVRLEPEWRAALIEEFAKPYMQELRAFLLAEYRAGKTIYPRSNDIFNALNTTPLSKVRVVILGQDPYHGPNQAHGLCFSVLPGQPPPPSLQNIYKELATDLQVPLAQHGCLLHWAKQGVLLLNAVLTVERGRANAHQNRGWEQFTDRIVAVLNAESRPLVFVLWGSPAQRKGAMIDGKKHLILRSPHPSPLSASRGFFGCRHFSKINEFLRGHGATEINWRLPSIAEVRASLSDHEKEIADVLKKGHSEDQEPSLSSL